MKKDPALETLGLILRLQQNTVSAKVRRKKAAESTASSDAKRRKRKLKPMKRIVTILSLLFALQASAAPVQIVCNGTFLNPQTGRPIGGQLTTFAFLFDQQTQTMIMTEGADGRVPMTQVSITETSAKGVNKQWVYEINRIEGVATIRSISEDATRYGITGNYFRGTCATSGQAKF